MAVRAASTSSRSRGDRTVGSHLDWVANLAADLGSWCNDLQLQDYYDHPGVQIGHLVADLFLDLDNCKQLQVLVMDHVVEVGGQHGEAVGVKSVRQKQPLSFLATSLNGFVTQHLNNWLTDFFTLADTSKSSIGQVKGHYC